MYNERKDLNRVDNIQYIACFRHNTWKALKELAESQINTLYLFCRLTPIERLVNCSCFGAIGDSEPQSCCGVFAIPPTPRACGTHSLFSPAVLWVQTSRERCRGKSRTETRSGNRDEHKSSRMLHEAKGREGAKWKEATASGASFRVELAPMVWVKSFPAEEQALRTRRTSRFPPRANSPNIRRLPRCYRFRWSAMYLRLRFSLHDNVSREIEIQNIFSFSLHYKKYITVVRMYTN